MKFVLLNIILVIRKSNCDPVIERLISILIRKLNLMEQSIFNIKLILKH